MKNVLPFSSSWDIAITSYPTVHAPGYLLASFYNTLTTAALHNFALCKIKNKKTYKTPDNDFPVMSLVWLDMELREVSGVEIQTDGSFQLSTPSRHLSLTHPSISHVSILEAHSHVSDPWRIPPLERAKYYNFHLRTTPDNSISNSSTGPTINSTSSGSFLASIDEI